MEKAHCLKLSRRAGLVLVMLISLTACGAGSEKWKEEVQLSDGKIIVVERDAIYVAGGDEWASNKSGSKINEYSIRFEYPIGSSRKLEWHTVKKDPFTYPEVPLVFDIVFNQPTIYTLIAVSAGCEVYSKYVYKNGTWIEEPLPDQFEQHTTNLLFASQRDLPILLKLAEKNKRNNDSRYRKTLKYVGPNLKVCSS